MNPAGTALKPQKPPTPSRLHEFRPVDLAGLHPPRPVSTGGELKRLIEEDGLRGMTSNPAIFEKAIGDSST